MNNLIIFCCMILANAGILPHGRDTFSNSFENYNGFNPEINQSGNISGINPLYSMQIIFYTLIVLIMSLFVKARK